MHATIRHSGLKGAGKVLPFCGLPYIDGSCKIEAIEFEGGRKEEREKDDKQPENVKGRKVGQAGQQKVENRKRTPRKLEGAIGVQKIGKRGQQFQNLGSQFFWVRDGNLTTAKNIQNPQLSGSAMKGNHKPKYHKTKHPNLIDGLVSTPKLYLVIL